MDIYWWLLRELILRSIEVLCSTPLDQIFTPSIRELVSALLGLGGIFLGVIGFMAYEYGLIFSDPIPIQDDGRWRDS